MKICVGIAGSIAAYRSVDLVKELKKQGHEVSCLLTRAGREFVSPRVLESFSGRPVLSHDVWAADHFATDHIASARWADLFIVYGASANFLARAALGMGDDFLTLQLLAYTGRKILAPAMNPSMWEHPAVQANVATLVAQGWTLVPPIAGEVACGESGIGHLASHASILAAALGPAQAEAAEPSLELPGLRDRRVLISAGPMRTTVDSVRYLQNRSSGRMGLEIARAGRAAGAAEVKVLLGPVEKAMRQSFRQDFEVYEYESASDYEAQLESLFPQSDVFFSAAAVLDFELESRPQKMERSFFESSRELKLPLRPVPDIVARFAARRGPEQRVIAFAAESGSEEEIIARATQKMLKKGVHALIANPVWEGLGPDAERNQLWVLRPGQAPLKLGPDLKRHLARPLLEALFG